MHFRQTTEAPRPLRSVPKEMNINNVAYTTSVPSLQNHSVVASDISEHTHQLMARPYHLLAANGGAVGHIYSNDLHNNNTTSMGLAHERHVASVNSPFIAETAPWSPSFSDLLEYPLDSAIQSGQMNGASVLVDGDIRKQNEWEGLALGDELITVDEPLLPSDWEAILLDTSSNSASKVQQPMMQPQIQQPQVVLRQPSPCVESQPLARTASSNSNNNSCNSSSNGATKTRMRWTSELHEAFVDAVRQLGGSSKATPKAVLKHMKIEGLTIYHVKSHLQKYRTARFIPEPAEGLSETNLTPIERMTSLDMKRGIDMTEALRLQMEVQKQLHDQLEIQRNMQLRIEEQGKALEKMFEKQNMAFGKAEQEEKISVKTPDSGSEESDSQRSKRPRN